MIGNRSLTFCRIVKHMAELTLRLVVDPTTGKKNLIIAYESDSDALPMEHEEEHRRLVDTLIEGGALAAAELGAIIIEREQSKRVVEEVCKEEAQSERGKVSTGIGYGPHDDAAHHDH